MDVQFQLRVPGEVLETTLGWPPSDGADITMVGTGDAGLIEVLDVPEHLRDIAPEGLAALSFLTDEFRQGTRRGEGIRERRDGVRHRHARRRPVLLHDGRVPVEFMGSYAPEANSETSDATND